jgi:HEAT repeat protein
MPSINPESRFLRDLFLLFVCTILSTTVLYAAAERDVDAAMLAAQGHSPDEEEPPRPDKLPDLTKGERIPLPKKGGPITWNIGQTGIIGVKNGSFEGDQIRVVSVLPGSPAEGKVIPGDVILGVQDIRFKPGGHMGYQVGNALIKAEEPANKGIFKLHLWRDKNWTIRTGPKDMFGVDVEELFKEAQDDDSLYDWQDEEEREKTVANIGLDKYPIDPIELDVTLQLKVIGKYSDTSPWDCPAVTTIRENALKIISDRITDEKRGRNRGSWPDVLALVASGNPAYIKQAKDWVHSQKLETDMNHEVTLDDVTYRGMQSWHHGFNYLEMAIYYDATGDEYVLPEVRKRAICAALGQNGGGSWGHTFAFREFNGGLLHKNNPGYGAMNNAGTRCFFLMALARKAGIKHPELDAAIERSERFFRTFVDKGCIPYGYHPPAGSDDSNGKNYGAAYGFYVLGKKYEAKFFSMHSSHASFTRRGGHGSPTLWYYTPLSQNISGPKAIQATHRNMRWFYTLARKYDGSFVFQGEQAGIGGRGMRNPTATHALFYSYPLGKTIITGKDADSKFWMTDEEYNELLVSARGQLNDPELIKQSGKPVSEKSTDELLELLDHFYPKFRNNLAEELGKRYQAGESDILQKVLPLLSDSEDRMRAGACQTLSQLGRDEVLSNMTKVVALLKDDAEFVRMIAARTIGGATDPGDDTRELALLNAVINDLDDRTMDNGNVGKVVKEELLPKMKRGYTGPTTKMVTAPFQAGYDEELVRSAMERIVTLDPGGIIPADWTRETLINLAGPVVFAAEILQVNDAMFGGARKRMAQDLLRKHNYREGFESDAYNLRARSLLDRDMRIKVTFKDSYITPAKVKDAPGNYEPFLPDLYLFLHDKPNHTFSESTGKNRPKIYTPLPLLIAIIENNKTGQRLPSISDDVERLFRGKLDAAGSTAAKISLCREELKDLDRKNYFRKIHAMTALKDMLGPDALSDIAPFLGHKEPRLHNHSRMLVLDMVKSGQGADLLNLYNSAKDRDTGIEPNMNAAAMLQVLADGGYKPAMETIRTALKHPDSKVRKQAIEALFKVGGDAELRTVFEYLVKANYDDERFGCENAILSRVDEPAHVERCSKAAQKLIGGVSVPARSSLAYLMGQFGGPENLEALRAAAMSYKSEQDLKNIIFGLAYSPDRAADKVMVELVKQDEIIRDATAALSVHRMVGPHGMKDVTHEERVDFAREVLARKIDPQLVTFLGKVPTAPAARLLFDVMKRGEKNTATAVDSIISIGENLDKPSKQDAEVMAEVLTDVIEYIEVVHLRGGVAVHVKDHLDARAYTAWQTQQSRAGQALLKFNKPKKAPIPTFNDLDLDI